MDKSPQILILDLDYNPLSPEHIKVIENIVPKENITVKKPSNLLEEDLSKAKVIYGNLPPDLIKKAKNLEWLQLSSAGAESYIKEKRNFHLTNASGVYGIPIAEHVLAMILSFNRNLFFHFDNTKNSRWKNTFDARDFYGSVVGIIGFGDIGMEVAKRSYALGAEVLAMKNSPREKPEYISELFGPEGLDEILSRSDYLVLALPHTKKTTGLIDKDKFSLMKPGCYLVNVGRGSCIVQKDLVDALKEKKIAGAGLDVTSPEPLSSSDPLWKLPNVIITSHSSGVSKTNNLRNYELFIENLKRYSEGRKLKNLVFPEKGY